MRLSDDAYEKLADALDGLPNGFPRTPSKVEIRILKRIFSPDEALLACNMSREQESPDAIATRLGLPVDETVKRLRKMAEKDLLWVSDEVPARFRLAPFIVGIYESSNMDHELAHLMEEYLANGGAEGIMRPQPALHRVIPAQQAMKTEQILPYDDVKAILVRSQSFALRDCICREERKLTGYECRFPMRTCLSFSPIERPRDKDSISREEALAFLDESEGMGLVHTVRNVMKGIGYVCNCCGCCCGIMRGITDWGIENSVASSNYIAHINPGECTGCGTCVERCQVHAIREENCVAIVDRGKCIGCGLCATGCPSGAAILERKPDELCKPPPEDFAAWEHERLRNRGLSH